MEQGGPRRRDQAGVGWLNPCPGRDAALLQRCFAEPGPYQTPAPVTAPALQRTVSQGLHAALRPGHRSPSPQIQFLEEIVALVVDDDEGRKILDFDAPDRF